MNVVSLSRSCRCDQYFEKTLRKKVRWNLSAFSLGDRSPAVNNCQFVPGANQIQPKQNTVVHITTLHHIPRSILQYAHIYIFPKVASVDCWQCIRDALEGQTIPVPATKTNNFAFRASFPGFPDFAGVFVGACRFFGVSSFTFGTTWADLQSVGKRPKMVKLIDLLWLTSLPTLEPNVLQFDGWGIKNSMSSKQWHDYQTKRIKQTV